MASTTANLSWDRDAKPRISVHNHYGGERDSRATEKPRLMWMRHQVLAFFIFWEFIQFSFGPTCAQVRLALLLYLLKSSLNPILLGEKFLFPFSGDSESGASDLRDPYWCVKRSVSIQNKGAIRDKSSVKNGFPKHFLMPTGQADPVSS